jgi:hypothetical protein
MSSKITLDQSAVYCIKVQGKLGENWASYFEEMDIVILSDTDENPITMLTGEMPDQAAVQGVLQKLYNLGFPLISVMKVDPLNSAAIASDK